MAKNLKNLSDEQLIDLYNQRHKEKSNNSEKSAVGREAVNIIRSLSSIPGAAIDLAKLPAELIMHGVAAARGKNYDGHFSWAEESKRRFDKATNNYGKSETPGEKIREDIYDLIAPNKVGAAKNIGRKVVKLLAPYLPGAAGVTAGRLIEEENPESTGTATAARIGIPLATALGKGGYKKLAHRHRLGKVGLVEKKLIKDISERSVSPQLSPYTHEVSGKSLHRKARIEHGKELHDVTSALEKIRNNRAYAINQARQNRNELRSAKSTEKHAFLSPEELQKIYATEEGHVGKNLVKGAQASQERHRKYFGKEYEKLTPTYEEIQISGDPAIEWFAESFNKLDKPNLKKAAMDSEVGKVIKGILGLDSNANLQTFEAKLYKTGPTTLNYHETQLLRDVLNDKSGDLTGLFGPKTKARMNQLNHFLGSEIKQSILQHDIKVPKYTAETLAKTGHAQEYHMDPLAFYENLQKKSGLKQEHLHEPLNAILKNEAHPNKALKAALAEKGVESNTLEIARKLLPLDEQRELGNAVVKDLGFSGQNFSGKQLAQRFASLPHDSQRSVYRMLDADTRGKIKAHVNHPETYESITQKIPEYHAVDKAPIRQTQEALTKIKQKGVKSPSELFRESKKNVLQGNEPIRGGILAQGITADLARNELGHIDISKLRAARDSMQPEVWAKIRAKLPPEMLHNVESGISELSFLDKLIKNKQKTGIADQALHTVSPKASYFKRFLEKRANTEKQYPKIKAVYEAERIGKRPKMFDLEHPESFARVYRSPSGSNLTPEHENLHNIPEDRPLAHLSDEALIKRYNATHHHAKGDIVKPNTEDPHDSDSRN